MSENEAPVTYAQEVSDPESLESTTTNDMTPVDDGGLEEQGSTSTDDLDINATLEAQERQRDELREGTDQGSTSTDDVEPTGTLESEPTEENNIESVTTE